MIKTSTKLVVFFLFLCFSLLRAQSKIDIDIDKKNALIGDKLILSIRVSTVNNLSVKLPIYKDSLIDDFRVVELIDIDTLFSGQEKVFDYKYHITSFNADTIVFPKIKILIGEKDTVFTKPITIIVSNPDLKDIKDIKPLKGIYILPLSSKEILNYLIVSLLLFILALIIYFIYIKYLLKEDFFENNKINDPPHIIALKSLKEIENSNWIGKGEYKIYYQEISNIIRLYIEKRYFIQALEQTTSQLLDNLINIKLDKNVFDFLKNMLKTADLAKFAKVNPSEYENSLILKDAYKFIQNTQIANDLSKKIDAQKVRKFYANNEYKYKKTALNFYTLKAIVIGFISTIVFLSFLIASSYLIPIEIIQSYLSVYPLLFFAFFIFIGVLILSLFILIKRNKMKNFKILFDFDSVFISKNFKTEKILYTNIKSLNLEKQNRYFLIDKFENKFIIDNRMEYFDEIIERIQNIISTI